jgi:hypothetical protein
MFKRVLIVLLAVGTVAIAVNPVFATTCRTYPYCTLYPQTIDLVASVVEKYSNKYDVFVTFDAIAPEYLPGSPLYDYLHNGLNDNKCVCRNPGENGWTAPGQNPPPGNFTYSGVSILYYIPKNGKIIATVTGQMEQPSNISDFCPNTNWSLDCVPEYVATANIQEILVTTASDGTQTCYLASSATLIDCFVDLSSVQWDPEIMEFTGPAYTCVAEPVLNTITKPFENPPITCPTSAQ